MIITQKQLSELDAIMLDEFFLKVANYLRDEVPAQMEQLNDATAFIKEQYAHAERAGHKTERAIVQFILAVITKP